MMLKRIDDWKQFGFTLIVFWAALCLAQTLFTDAAVFNQVLTARAAQAGYLLALRGLCLLTVLLLALTMAALLRQGLIIAPFVWLIHFLRFTLIGPWQQMLKNLLFVSELFNLLVIAILPVVLAVLLWRLLAKYDSRSYANGLAPPVLWASFAATALAGSFFTWYWSQVLAKGPWLSWFSLIYLLAGLSQIILTASSPGRALTYYFMGLLAPLPLAMMSLGWFDGLYLFLTASLPFAGEQFIGVWFSFMLMFAAPLLLAVIGQQYCCWRRGDALIDPV